MSNKANDQDKNASQQDKPATSSGAARERLVKIKAKTDIAVGGKIVTKGTVVEVSESEASEFCDRVFSGPFDWGGERSVATATRPMVRRAERVA